MRWTGERAPPPLPPPRKRIGFPAEILLIESREGCGPLELSRGRRGRIPLRATLSQIPLKSCGFPGAESARKRFFLRGASSPPKKSARSRRTGRRDRLEVERVHTLSSSPGLFWWRNWFPTKQVVLLRTLFPTARAWGALLPYTPSGDGVREGCDPLALSRGLLRREFRFPTMRETASVEMLVFGDAKGCLSEDLVSDGAGVGRSAPLHPLG